MLNNQPEFSFLTTTFTINSPLINYYFNFTFEQKKGTPVLHESQNLLKEVILINFSPETFELERLQQEYGTFDINGLAIIIFRDVQNNPVFFLKEFDGPTYYTMSEIHSEHYERKKEQFCNFEFINSTVLLNATLDFNNCTFYFYVNNTLCVSYKFNKDLFHEKRASLSIMARVFSDELLTMYLDEVSITKQVPMLTEPQNHFHYSMHKLSHTVHNMDPHYLKNVSLANLFINGVF